jgi:hypothetical protein
MEVSEIPSHKRGMQEYGIIQLHSFGERKIEKSE